MVSSTFLNQGKGGITFGRTVGYEIVTYAVRELARMDFGRLFNGGELLGGNPRAKGGKNGKEYIPERL